MVSTEQEQPEAEFDASKWPYLNLMSHISQKGYQVGSIASVAIVMPLTMYRNKSMAFEPTLKPMGMTMLGFTAFTTLLGLGMCATRIDRDGAIDRSYRLHYNASQNNVDLLSQIGGVSWGVATAGVFTSNRNWSLLGGAAVGCAMGLLMHATTWKSTQKTGSVMVEELKVLANQEE